MQLAPAVQQPRCQHEDTISALLSANEDTDHIAGMAQFTST